MAKRLILSVITTSALACSYSAFAQLSQTEQQRIIEPIIVNGQQAQGALVVQNGRVQGYSCPSPQPYVTIDQRESGWACFEETTGMWLLHAQPPLQATASQPVVVYNQPAAVYAAPPVYGYYPYPYYRYGYLYPHVIARPFGFAFRSPILVTRPVVIGRPFAQFGGSRAFGGFRAGGRSGFSRAGRR